MASSLPPPVEHSAVRPRRPERLSAVVTLCVALLSFGGLWLLLPLRHDAAVLGVPELFTLSALEISAALALFMLGLRQLTPGRLSSTSVLLSASLAMVACGALVTWRSAHVSGLAPPPGSEFSSGALCATMIGLLSLPYGLAFKRAFALRLTPRRNWAGAMLSLSAAVAANAVWRLFCPYSETLHQLLGHGGAACLTVAAALIALRLSDRGT